MSRQKEVWTIETENEDRVRRARSWLKKSKRARSDIETFLYLWISFNAAYGKTADDGGSADSYEQGMQDRFLHEICRRDGARRLQEVIVKEECRRAILDLMKNEFICEDYWICVRKRDRSKWTEKKNEFEKKNEKVKRYITSGSLNPREALPMIFERLYTLRNQVVHGAVTVRHG